MERQGNSMAFVTRFNRPKHAGKAFPDASRTKQADKDSCDINQIMKRFEKTGVLPEMIKGNPQYGDFSSGLSYQESLNIVMHAQEQFNALSARVRERFGNDPKVFLDFATDPVNGPEMVKLGLAVAKKAPPEIEEKLNKATKREKEPAPPKGGDGRQA